MIGRLVELRSDKPHQQVHTDLTLSKQEAAYIDSPELERLLGELVKRRRTAFAAIDRNIRHRPISLGI
jgi:hypothetical protein